jgi:spore maturation protein CgeB
VTELIAHRAAIGQRVMVLGEDAPGGLMQSYASAFRRLGAEVSTYCMASAFRNGLNATATRVANRLAPTVLLRRFNAKLLADVGEMQLDLVLVLKGERIAPATITELRRRTGATWLNFYPDDPFSDVRSNRLAYGPATLGAYEHCFTFARHLIAQYRASGIHRVTWLPFARDPDQHSPTRQTATPEFDVVFVGNLDDRRVQWLEGVAMSFNIAVFGEHTRAAVSRGSVLRKASFLPAAYGAALSRALARGAISLNLMRHQNRFSHNMRSFESLACGAFTLSQRTPELCTMFREDVEVAFASTPQELPDRVGYWLSHAAERERIGAAGFRRVENDTYEERARTILAVLPVPI